VPERSAAGARTRSERTLEPDPEPWAEPELPSEPGRASEPGPRAEPHPQLDPERRAEPEQQPLAVPVPVRFRPGRRYGHPRSPGARPTEWGRAVLSVRTR
jgi:hypothetical protein